MTDRLSRRHILLSAAGAGAALSWPNASVAQTQPSRPFRVTVFAPRADIGDIAGFRDYFANSRIPVDYDVQVVTDMKAMPEKVAAVKAKRPDLIFTVFTPLTEQVVGPYDAADRSAFVADIPVVFSSVTNPVASRIVPRLDQPGRNVTGTRHIAPVESQIKTIQSYRPVNRIAIIYNPGESNMVVTAQELRDAQQALGFTLIDKPVPKGADGKPDAAAIPDLIAQAKREGAEFIYIGPDTLVGSQNNAAVAKAALEQKLPSFCATELPIRRADILMGLVSRAYNVGRFAGFKASEILLNGKRPQDVPVETLKRFSLIIRIGVAQQLGLYPPMRLLNIAEVVTA